VETAVSQQVYYPDGTFRVFVRVVPEKCTVQAVHEEKARFADVRAAPFSPSKVKRCFYGK